MFVVCPGPVLGFQVVDVEVTLRDLKTGPGTSMPMVTSCVSQAVTEAIHNAGPLLMEPIMSLEVVCCRMYYKKTQKVNFSDYYL